MEAKKPKGFSQFDALARKLVKVPPEALDRCTGCGGTGKMMNVHNEGCRPCPQCRGTGTSNLFDAVKRDEEIERLEASMRRMDKMDPEEYRVILARLVSLRKERDGN